MLQKTPKIDFYRKNQSAIAPQNQIPDQKNQYKKPFCLAISMKITKKMKKNDQKPTFLKKKTITLAPQN